MIKFPYDLKSLPLPFMLKKNKQQMFNDDKTKIRKSIIEHSIDVFIRSECSMSVE